MLDSHFDGETDCLLLVPSSTDCRVLFGESWEPKIAQGSWYIRVHQGSRHALIGSRPFEPMGMRSVGVVNLECSAVGVHSGDHLRLTI